MTTIEVFADIACPFTHVGLRRFVQRREELGRPDVTLLVRAWPLEVVNGQPLDPAATADKGRAVVDAAAQQLVRLLQELHDLPLATLVDGAGGLVE